MSSWRGVRWARTWWPIYWLFCRQPGTTITVARQTSSVSGETVQLSTTVPIGATAMEIAEAIETLSMAGQARMLRDNALLLKTDLAIAHEKWKRVWAKKQSGVKFSVEERRFWQRHERDFTVDGPVETVSDARITEAAHDQEPKVA